MKYCWIVFDGSKSPVCVCSTKEEALKQLEKLIREVRVHESIMEVDIQHIRRMYEQGFDEINAGSQFMMRVQYIDK